MSSQADQWRQRVEELADIAIAFFEADVSEYDVRYDLLKLLDLERKKRGAPSPDVARGLVDAAISRAKAQLEAKRKNLYMWVPPKDPSETEP